MTFSFTLGKRFFKALHYILKSSIFLILMLNLPPLFKEAKNFYKWAVISYDFYFGDGPDPNISLVVKDGVVLFIWCVLVFVVIRVLSYRHQNIYGKDSPTPRDDYEYYLILPKKIVEVYVVSAVIILWASIASGCEGPHQKLPSYWGLYGFAGFHLILSYIALFRARIDQKELMDHLWSGESDEITLIIKYKSLLAGNTPDGLVHLKIGDRVKLVPSDVPNKHSLIHVLNETPNGSVLMDTIYSFWLSRELDRIGDGYMYGRITGFKNMENIKLTMHTSEIHSRYFEIEDLDPYFKNAAYLVVKHQRCSTLMIKRAYQKTYIGALRIINQLEAKGIVSTSQGSKAREVLIKSEEELKRKLDEIMDE